VRAARIMGLNVAGVDLLRSNHGPVVMEVNSSPGLEGIEGATNKDVAGLMIANLEKLQPGKTRTKDSAREPWPAGHNRNRKRQNQVFSLFQ
jgi:ribosomal protein S6--L-glutamate ligase